MSKNLEEYSFYIHVLVAIVVLFVVVGLVYIADADEKSVKKLGVPQENSLNKQNKEQSFQSVFEQIVKDGNNESQ